jgi:hypothetical protein
MQRTNTSIVTRSVRFGAAVAISTFAIAIIGAGVTYTRASNDGGSVEMAAAIAGVERVEASSTPSISFDEALARYGASADGPVEGAPIAESTVAPAPTPTIVVAAARIVAPPVAAPAPIEAAPEPRIVASRATTYDVIAATFPPGEVDRAYRVAMCESSGNAHVNTGNGYYGLWQFDLPTWQSVGGTGLPSSATLEEQVARARMLYDSRGWSPWGCA